MRIASRVQLPGAWGTGASWRPLSVAAAGFGIGKPHDRGMRARRGRERRRGPTSGVEAGEGGVPRFHRSMAPWKMGTRLQNVNVGRLDGVCLEHVTHATRPAKSCRAATAMLSRLNSRSLKSASSPSPVLVPEVGPRLRSRPRLARLYSVFPVRVSVRVSRACFPCVSPACFQSPLTAEPDALTFHRSAKK
jgi:hypothetical protein